MQRVAGKVPVTPRRRRSRRTFGAIRRLPSGRLQASYLGPDLVRYVAPNTFTARVDAEGWLHRQRAVTERGEWEPPTKKAARRPATFGEYAPAWLDTRDLPSRTRVLYDSLLRTHLSTAFGDAQAPGIT